MRLILHSLLQWQRIKRLAKALAKTLAILLTASIVILIVFANFYSYSSLTRFVYSIEWLLVYTPLFENGELVIPAFISIPFQHLHAFKISLTRLSSQLYPDGYPDFEGKYHWARGELNACSAPHELLNGQERDPNLRCYIDQRKMMFLKTEVLNLDPAIVKYHGFMPPHKVKEFNSELDRFILRPSRILVRDTADGSDLWQDSLVVNGTFVPHHFSAPMDNAFNYIQSRVSAFDFSKAESFHIKKYRPGGHYAPHLDYLIVNPEPQLGNRLATFMIILQSASNGGGTLFPQVGVNFQPKPGDAILWLNANTDYSVAQGSFHGACPVLAGTKLGVTLWVRSVGQELSLPCPLQPGRPFEISLSLDGKSRDRVK